MRVAMLLFLTAVIMSGCASKFPNDESALTFSYPLKHCDSAMLDAARQEMQKSSGAPELSNRTVCVTAPRPGTPPAQTSPDDVSRLEQQAFADAEAKLRISLEAAFFPAERPGSNFGIALSGGGTKASSFAMGVLAGLADHDLLDRADYLSSVSGGGYAAYFYYTHRLFPLVRPGVRTPVTNTELFRDCVSDPEGTAVEEISAKIKSTNYCGRREISSRSPKQEHQQADIRYQSLVKCTQDLLRPGYCDMKTTAGLDSGISLATVLGSASSLIFSNISNTLFDWGYSMSPSARSYKDGIGISYGATLTQAKGLSPYHIINAVWFCGENRGERLDVLDCTPNMFDSDPVPLTFEELRAGLIKSSNAGRQLPFWIMNAAAPESRSVFGWTKSGREDITNSDMFEMTAVSHGSGRFGYVSASPGIHDMSVLDSIAASAAFLDANQLVLQNRAVRTGAGALLHVFNFDWGYDIANYNVSSTRRRVHRSLPVPFYWLDSPIARATLDTDTSAEMKDRHRSVFIRLIDGGNAENLGVYSLLKRGVRNILISDAAQDEDGLFNDICGLARRLQHPSDGRVPSHLYIPGLADFSDHCTSPTKKKFAYDMQGWLARHPVLFGCIRRSPAASGSSACADLKHDEVRLFIVKPAINFDHFVDQQMGRDITGKVMDCHVRGVDVLTPDSLLNCDSAIFLKINHGVERGVSKGCPIFPQHGTVLMTANSSGTMFVAYRELARQYVGQAAGTIAKLLDGDPQAVRDFEEIAAWHSHARLFPRGTTCGAGMAPAGPVSASPAP